METTDDNGVLVYSVHLNEKDLLFLTSLLNSKRWTACERVVRHVYGNVDDVRDVCLALFRTLGGDWTTAVEEATSHWKMTANTGQTDPAIELERFGAKCHEEGFTEGYDKGYIEGYADGAEDR